MESPNINLLYESLRQVRLGAEEVADIWRHEGLKKGVEFGISQMSHTELSRWALKHLTGGVVSDTRLSTNVGGLDLAGPVGIAPGWDKTGKTILGWQALGANHITPGGVTFYPQKGNQMPRLRTFDKHVGDHGTAVSLNAYGFPSLGAAQVAYNIAKQRESGDLTIPVITQVTLNKEMYEEHNRHTIPTMLAVTVRKMRSVSDGFNLGLSSPNTMGMRDAQAYEFLYRCIMAVKEVIGNDLPLGLKGDGDGGEERWEMYSKLAQTTELSYLELINTTALAPIKAKYGAENLPGGLAGADPDYQNLAVTAVNYAYEAVGDKTDVMGMGGVNSAERAIKLIRAGASGIGINTAIRQLGAGAVKKIERGISDELDKYTIGTKLDNIIGLDNARGPKVKLAV